MPDMRVGGNPAMTYYNHRCISEDCDWSGTRRSEWLTPCPWCGGPVETYEARHYTRDDDTTADEFGLVRPSAKRTPFGIPKTAPRLAPWYDGTRTLPNGMRARIVRLPSVADALDHARQHRSDSVAEVLAYTSWHKDNP